jgi:hypothetical protein
MGDTVLTLVLQVLFPLALLGVLTFHPPSNLVGAVAQILGTGFYLLALALVVPWILLPWWLAYLYGVVFVFVNIYLLVRRRQHLGDLFPLELRSRVVAVFFLILAGMSAYVIAACLVARTPGDQKIAEITMPLGPGRYLVAQGGSSQLVNGHFMTLDTSVERFKSWRGQSYGVDIIKLDDFGLRVAGWRPQNPTIYHIYGTPILAPCAGIVAAAVDGLPEMAVAFTDREHMLGNHVILDCGTFTLVLAHMMTGSVEAKIGLPVAVGTPLGKVGNSGNSSEPHLHIHAQSGMATPDPIAAEPIMLTINGWFPVRNDRFVVP